MLVTSRSACPAAVAMLLAALASPRGELLFPRHVLLTTGGNGTLYTAIMEDLDGDGRQDIAVTSAAMDRIEVFISTGGGEFATSVAVPVGDGPHGLVAGRLDADTHVDLVVALSFSHQLQVLLGNGDGTFATQPPFSSSELYPLRPLLGRFDGDEVLDLAVLHDGARLSIYGGNGDGTFGAESVVEIPSGGNVGLRSADFNLDSHLDLVTGRVFVPGDGAGGFGPPVPIPFPVPPATCCPKAVDTADFDGDGKPDLAVAVAASGVTPADRVEILKGNGDGSFTPHASYTIQRPVLDMIVTDLDANGEKDLAVLHNYLQGASTGTKAVAVLLGNGDGSFSPGSTGNGIGGPPRSLAEGDVNQDGVRDLVVVPSGYDQILLLEGRGDGSFFDSEVISGLTGVGSGNNWGSSARVADLDLDGNPDLATAGIDRRVMAVYGRGDGTFEVPVTVANLSPNSAQRRVLHGDFDGNGIPDLVSTGAAGAFVMLGLGNRAFASPTLYASPNASPNRSGALGDFNADGHQDLCFATLAGSVSVLLGTGDGTFLPERVYLTGISPRSVAVADFDLDGAQDLAVPTVRTIDLLRGRGDGTFETARPFEGASGQNNGIAPGDFNADGRPDVVVGNDDGNAVAVHVAQEDGSLVLSEAKEPYFVAPGPATGDFNLDGHLDVAAPHFWGGGAGHTMVFLGNGDGTLGPESAQSVGGGPTDVAVGDFNLDGAPDLAATHLGSGRIHVLLNRKPAVACLDADGDGYGSPGNALCLGGMAADCDDARSFVHPGAVESCDLFDNDCDGAIDEGFDADGDGITSCNGDCDESRTNVHRFMVEDCEDDRDNDCDGFVDRTVPENVTTPTLSMEALGLSWEDTGFMLARGYDVVRGDLSLLHTSGGDYAASVTGCVVNDSPYRSIDEAQVPAAGQGIWYLVRGANCAAEGSYNDSPFPAHPSRDASIAAAPLACP